jgi:tetratricopeptide (TPR) repeat protein/tRNA A-37 threonylcarbamoyl transferase component Bud32/TolB-like protein
MGEPYPSDLTKTALSALDLAPAGTRLAGRYRIEGVLGAGAMGVVYRAHDEQLDADVALKALRAERRYDDAALERFRREILIARKVTHPKVVRIHDIGRDGDIVFLTMDLVPGATLRERLADGPLKLSEALAIARDVAEALAAAHACGVVHRDLKPANVLIDAAGVARLADFGVARAVRGDDLTAEGAVAGTPDYLAPEQIRGETVDGRADIFALGLLLHEMLTGDVPLRGQSLAETAARRAAGRTAALPKLKGVPRGVQRIVERCLEPRPEDRYPTAAELAGDLARGAANFRLKRNARRAAAAAALALVAAGAAWWGIETRRPDAAPEAALREAPAPARIAFLPFENATGDAGFDWIRRGLPETLSTALAERPTLQPIESLRVFRTIEALRLPDGPLDEAAVRQLAALLDADEIVSGRIIGDSGGRRLELTVTSWPAGGSRPIRVAIGEGGLLAAADVAVAEILAALDVPPEDEARPVALSADPAAMAAYDEGVALMARGETLSAIGPLENSVAADSAFAAGWTALSRAYLDAGRREDALGASEKALAALGGAGGRAALMTRAQHAVLSAEPETAFELLKEAVERYPNDEAARLRLAELQGEYGQFKEAIEHLKIVAAADPNHPRAWYLLGRYSVLSGDARAAAEDYLVRALIIQNRVGDAQGRGEVFNAMGLAHERLGELDIARQHFRNAVELRREAGDRRGQARSLANIARLDMIAGDFAAARAALTRSLEEMTEAGDSGGVADLRNEFGVLEEEAGDYRAALNHYREALRLRRELGEGGLAESYTNLAFIYLVLGEYDNAAAYARDARAEFAAAGDAHGELTALELDAELALARGDWADASRAYVRELELSRELDAPFSEAVAEGGLALVALYQGRPKAALDGNQRALEILAPLNDQRGLNEFRLRRAAILLAIGLPEEAEAELKTIASIESEGNIGQQAEYYRLQGIVAASGGRTAAAAAAFATAAELAEKSGSEALRLRTDLARARYAPDPTLDSAAIVERAARLGHAPMRLEALELLAARRFAESDFAAAAAAARQGLRPPAAIDPWIDNWRLNARLWRALEAAGAGASEEAAHARSAARTQLEALLEATPQERREGLASLSREGNEGVDVP